MSREVIGTVECTIGEPSRWRRWMVSRSADHMALGNVSLFRAIIEGIRWRAQGYGRVEIRKARRGSPR